MLRRPSVSVIGALVTLLFASRAVAQKPVPPPPPPTDSSRRTTLEEITVTAERERAAPPPVVTVDVPPDVLRREPGGNAYDLVRRAAGIEVHEQGQGPGFASDAVIRGFTSDHSSDVLLVIDGVPINLPIHGHVEGYADWSILSPAAVSALRVINGPASPLYGDFAMGGVVEVFTAADASGTAGGLGVTSYGDASGWTRIGRRTENGGWLAALDGNRQQGWRQNDDYWLGNVLLRGWHRAGRGRVEAGVMMYGSTWDSPGFVSVARYNAGDLVTAVDPTDGGSARRLIGHVRYGVPFGANTSLDASMWGQLLRSQVFLNIPEEGDVHQSQEEDRRHAIGGQAQLNWAHGTGTATLGISGRLDWTDYTLLHTTARHPIAPEQANDANYLAAGVFGRWRALLGSRFIYDVGGRIDVMHYASLDELTPALGWQSATHVIVSPKLGARYLLSDRLSLIASLSRGFRGAVGVIAAPELQPMVTWAKEIGIAYVGERWQVQAALFQQDVANERILDPVTRDVFDAGRSRRRGVSFVGGVMLSSRLRAIGELTVNDTKIKPLAESSDLVVPPTALSAMLAGPPLRPSFHDVPLPPGSSVPGVADYLGRAGLEVAVAPKVAARGLIRFSGPFEPIGEPGVTTQPYAIVDAGVSIALHAVGGLLDIDVLNLFDTKYPELRASGFLNPGVPRTLTVGVRFEDGR